MRSDLIRFDPKFRGIASATGLWPFHRIMVGKDFLRFNSPQRAAILWHEFGHIRLWHAEKRLLRILMNPFRDNTKAIDQHEFEADDYAKAAGYGKELAEALEIIDLFTPRSALRTRRIARLRA